MRILLLSWLFLISFLANSLSITMILVSGQCQNDQQSMLLQMKNSLVFDSSLSVRLVKWNQSTDCCTWSGVDCDVEGHVIGLNLSFESISGGIENSTGLFGLQYLQSLNLAFNWFNTAQIPPRLANLTNLTYLNLSTAGFVGQIPIAISGMMRLVSLDLSTNLFKKVPLLKLENPNLSVLVKNLTQLRELYLDSVNIAAQGDEWCEALSSSLPNLQVLSLSNCLLSGPINSSLTNLQSLSVIRLDMNNLSSPVPEFLADFPNLTSLLLSSCGLYGKIPKKLFQVPTIQTLDLSNNELHQSSLPEFPQNLSLQTLILWETNFSGTLPDSIGNLKNLSRIELAFCNFTGLIPTSMGNLSQLIYLDLSSNKFTGPIPSLHMSKNLTYLDLSRNVLSGAISSTDWEQLLNLVYVDLRHNSLSGSIPPSLFEIQSLQQLQLAYNQFEGQIPDFSNASSSLLANLDLSGNRLEGRIPMSVFELKNLNILSLSSNKFNGTMQLDLIQRLGSLTTLDLSFNSLAVIASDSSFLPQISTLRLASCKLGVIPNLKNQSILFNIDLSDNQISGEIPNWIWEVGNGSLNHLNLSRNSLVGLQEPYSVSDLTVLDLHSNWLQGKIPPPPPFAVFVDYSNNNFSNSIPHDIGNFLRSAIFFSLSNNKLTGVIPESICKATNLKVLDLSSNNLSGSIPACLIQRSEYLNDPNEMQNNLGVLNVRRNSLNGTISDKFPANCGFRTLNMNGNQLEGIIPKSLANCRVLAVLDLGNNHINDAFPCWLKNVSSLRVLVLRSNRFNGNIDCLEHDVSWPMLQIFDLASNNFNGRLPQKGLTTWEAMMVDADKPQSQLEHLQTEIAALSQLYYQDTVTVTSKGLEMELVKILTLFTSIDLSSNNFQGPIPNEIGLLKSLYVLDLSHNALTGLIPITIGNEGLYGPPLSNDDLTTNFYRDGTINSSEIPATSSNKFEFDWQVIIAIGAGFGVGFGAAVASPVYFKKIDICGIKAQIAVLAAAWTGMWMVMLLSLNLAYNSLNAAQIPSRFANLTNLTYLNLSTAGFVGQIPIAISGMTRLVSLDLSTDFAVGVPLLKLENPNLSMLVKNLTQLRELYLDSVNIAAHGDEWCEALSSSLPNLQVLSLSNCLLSGPINSSLTNLQSLSVIRLDMNNLLSPVPEFFLISQI
ncbi:hypothetical protein LWI28_012844 [Acer negundo]|uniref:Leucine-rich repeat-containing N-terminal plant-type domain-containing protein n=1 Tax=Acer negundo TaxID=4023 RepID=A0AAD5I6L6_ACENE|nr:hypothetical protein LWI28_012844 [Acer negundo]